MEAESTEERLEKLERTTRRYWLVLVGMGAILACAVAWAVIGTAGRAQAQKPGEVGKAIRANRFVLEDGNGDVLAALTMLDQTRPGLVLYDASGQVRAGLVMTADGPSLGLSDENGQVRAALGASKDGPMLSLFDENGKGGPGLSVTKGWPALVLFSAGGQVLAKLP